MFTGLCSKLEPMRPCEQQQFWGGTLGWCRSAVQGGRLRDSFQILIKTTCLLALSASACSLRTLIGVLLFLCIAVTAAGSGIMASLFAQDGNPVKVVARIRPVNRMEREKGSHISVSTSSDTQIEIQAEEATQKFDFDRVFASHVPQVEVYDAVVAPMVNGSGKTHTITGDLASGSDNRGLVPRLLDSLFSNLTGKMRFDVRMSYVEVYNEIAYDLIWPGASLDLVAADEDSGVTVVGAAEVPVRSATEAMEVVKRGAVNRRVAETKMNRESSRSHSVLVLMIAKQDGDAIRFSQLFVCDLAGSESAHKTQVSGTQLTEAGYINKSLLTLGRVIRALGKKGEHVPYRESKLTRLLSSALGGNSLTALVVTLSPSSWNASESLSTLRFGSATRLIKNTPTANTLLKDENLEEALRGAQQKVAANNARLQWLTAEIDQMKAAMGALGMGYADIQALVASAAAPGAPQLRAEWSGSDAKDTGNAAGGGGAAADVGGSAAPGDRPGTGDSDSFSRPDTAMANATHKSERDMIRTMAGSMSNVFLE